MERQVGPVRTPDWASPVRGKRGYDSELVEQLFERASLSYADVKHQRDDLLGQTEQQQAELTRLRAEQPLLQEALLSAHKTARDVVERAELEAERSRSQAESEAERIVDNARDRARDIVAEAEGDRAKAEQEAARLQIMARGIRDEYKDFVDRALVMLDGRDGDGETVVEMQATLVSAARSASEYEPEVRS